MLFSYLLAGLILGLVMGLIAALVGYGWEVFATCLGFALPMYFMEVAVRGLASFIKHRRVTYQLVDLGAFLLVVGLYVLSTSFSERAEVPMMLMGPLLYFFIVFWASKRVPMAPPRDWGNWVIGLPLLWERHLRREAQVSSVSD